MKVRLIGPESFPGPVPDRKSAALPLVDGSGRQVSYLRFSVTDRCDLRCTYCMPEKMKFLPKPDVLSFEEMLRLIDAFIARGVNKLRITGGEPLVRRDIMVLFEHLSTRLENTSLKEVSLTTNATRLEHHAADLKRFGVRRVNISLDTLSRETFRELTRKDQFDTVMRGIDAARNAGLKVKINTVALKGVNEFEIPEIIRWAHEQDFDISLIETMPLGTDIPDRQDRYLSLQTIRKGLEANWTLTPMTHTTGGPSRYVQISETGGRLGFISPLSHNFCDTCNRVRLTCTGMLYTCLGSEGGINLRDVLRTQNGSSSLDEVLEGALLRKPSRHQFNDGQLNVPATQRTMSVTGG